jgi:hypothetical protein
MPISAIIVLVVTVAVLFGGLSYCCAKAVLHKDNEDIKDTH